MHPYYCDYRDFILNNLNNEKKLLRFFTMFKLKESNLKWTLKQKNKKNIKLAYICGIKVRRFQWLKAEYKRTGKVPKLDPNRRPKIELSGGQKNLLDLAIVLVQDFNIILLDEPTAGVVQELRGLMKKVILKLKKTGKTIFLIEHDMNFVMEISDEIIVLENGFVLTKGKPKQIKNNKEVLRAYLGV